MPRISQARKAARRGQILTAAQRCFARLGFQGATIHDICAEAELSIGAVYSYFASKEAIVGALAEAGARSTAALLTTAPGGDPRRRLRVVLAALERPEAVDTFRLDVRAWAEAIGDGRLRDTTLGAHANLVAMLEELVAPLAADKRLQAPALAELIAALIAGCEVRRAIDPDVDLKPLLGALVALLQPAHESRAR